MNSFAQKVLPLMIAALFVIAGPMAAHADDSYFDSGGYDSGYSDVGGYDSGYSDVGGYDVSAPDYGYDVSAPDYGYDVSAPDNGYDVSAPDYGYDVSAPDYGYDVSAPEYDLSYDNSYTPSYSYSSSQPFSYSTPISYGSSYSTFVPPSYIPQQPIVIPQQQQQQQQQGGQPINIVNNNNNTNTNVNTTPVVQAQPQPIIQYVPQPIYQQPVYQQPIAQPYCTITATTGAGGLVYLTWSSSNATSAYISPSIGNVAPYGSTSLYTYGSTVYSMTVTGQGGTNTCATQSIAQSVPSVSLSQIPYTGYDFGPFGNALYWLALAAFAVAGAYLLVYFQGGAMTFLGSTFGHGSHGTEAHAAPAPIAQTVPVSAPTQYESRSVFASLPAAAENSTKDSMKIAHEGGTIPRIVISRA